MFSPYNSDRENPLEPLLLKSPWFSHNNQNPVTPLFFTSFSSPFVNEHEQLPLNQILPIPTPQKPAALQTGNDCDPVPKAAPANRGLKLPAKANDTRRNPSLTPKQRRGKKDRHSKICTAKGTRDRRMRLSLQAARKFFDLQDILGFDKASCTIEWLISKSKKAIRELMTENEKNNSNDTSFLNICFSVKNQESLSECDVVRQKSSNSAMESLLGNTVMPPNDKRTTRKAVLRKPSNSREAREKARARARWRTREKMIIRRLEFNSGQLGPQLITSTNSDQNAQKLGFSANAITDREHHDAGTIEELLGNSRFSSSDHSCSVHASDDNGYGHDKHLNSNLMGLCGNWDLLGNITV